MFALPESNEICKSCKRPFFMHLGGFPSQPDDCCRGFSKNIPIHVVSDGNQQCIQCNRMAKDHHVFTHWFVGGDSPTTRYLGDISNIKP
jgi:hypothetical protein